MKFNQLTVMPFLLAMVVGLAFMGTSTYDIHARELGTLDVGHLAGRPADELVIERTSPFASFLERQLLRFGDERGEIAADLLVPVSGIKALKQRAADLVKAMKEVQAKLGDPKLAADAPERAELRADMDKLMKLAEANAEELKQAEKLAEFERSLGVVQPDPDQEASRRAVANARIEVKDNAEEDPKRGFKDHRDFLMAVMDAGFGRRVDQRLLPLRAAQGSDEQGVYSDPVGGFLVPHGIAPGVLALTPEDDPIAPLTTKPPMMAPTVSFNARVDKDHSSSVSGGLVVTRRPETVDGASSRMKFEQITLTANELFGLAFATERIMTDSPISFVTILAAGFRDEYASKAMEERLHGGGVGEPLGVLNSPCLIEVPAENGQSAETILKENIDKMAARCWRYTRAVWLASMDTLPQLSSLVQVIGTGGNSVPYLQVDANGNFRLHGRPLYFTEHCNKLGNKGDLILGVWSEYLEGEYAPLRQDESIHVRFVSAERCFRFYKRNDGQPWWRTALTPKKGQPTLSPFVTLAAR